MKKFYAPVVLSLLMSLAGAASANTYNFTYIFNAPNPSTVVLGSFDGDASGDAITNLTNAKLSINGIDFGSNVSITGYTFKTAVASFSGTKNDFEFAVDPGDGTFMAFTMTYAFQPSHSAPYILNTANDQPLERFLSYDIGANGYWKVTDASGVSPVPEPGTYAMLLAGLGLMGFLARRRRKRSIQAWCVWHSDCQFAVSVFSIDS